MNGPTANGIEGASHRVDLIDTAGGRILCIADIRGKLSALNEYAAQHNAKAIIHTGDLGFFDKSSLSRISERTLRHLVQYSNLLSPAFRQQILSSSTHDAMRTAILQASQSSFALSEFPKLLTGELKLAVPVYTVYGACEDVAIIERLRAEPPGQTSVNQAPFAPGITSGPPGQANFSIPNLTVLSEGTTRAILIGGVRLRLFGLGGALVPHKFFDNGDGQATIAGAGGTMWTTILQIGELVDTAQRVYDPIETRLLVTHASPGREGLLAQLGLALKADLTVSAGLHFRYGISYNEYSVLHDADAYRNKLLASKMAFNEVWETVKTQVEQVIDDQQRKFLDNALAVANRLPAEPAAGQPAANVEEPAWKNSWNWNLPDANYGSLVLDVREGRFSAEMRSQGFNFAYRAQQGQPIARGPAVKMPNNHQSHGSNAPAPSSGAPSTSSKPVPPIGSVNDRVPPSGPKADLPSAAIGSEGHHGAPHHQQRHSFEDRGRGRGRGSHRGEFRGGPPRPQGNRDAPVTSADGEASTSSTPKPPTASLEGAAASVATTEGEGSQSQPPKFAERGRGRGRGRGDGMRGDFRGGRGGFRGRGAHNQSGSFGSNNAGSSSGDAQGSSPAPAPAPATNGTSKAGEEPAW